MPEQRDEWTISFCRYCGRQYVNPSRFCPNRLPSVGCVPVPQTFVLKERLVNADETIAKIARLLEECSDEATEAAYDLAWTYDGA
jgi:hypothetical protein